MPPGAIVLSQVRQVDPTRGSEGPDPGIIETLAAGFGAARADTTGQVEQRELEAYMEIAREIERMGGPRASAFVNPSTGTVSGESVWQAMEQQRAKGHFKGLPRSRDEFEQQWRARERERIERLERTAARGSGIAAFAGGVGGAMTDPINLYTLPFGGFGGNLAKRMAGEAAVGMLVEGVTQGSVAQQREALGRDQLTAAEAVQNVIFAGVGAAALRGAGDVLSNHWGTIKAAPVDLQEKAWASVLERVPALRDKVGAKVDWDALDAHLPDVVEAMVPPERMTAAERGAVNALRREAAIDAANPFVPDGAGVESHYRLLGEAIQGIVNEGPGYVPKGRASPAARLRSGTSVGSGVAPIADAPGDFDLAGYLARNRSAESGGNDAAAAVTSSAYGRYQFLRETWISSYKETFGETGETRQQILAKRANGAVQDRVMATFTNANRRALARAGFVADNGNTYLAHFLGTGDALKVLRADPAAPVRGLVDADSINANPDVFRNITSASELIAWAKRKMGGKGTGVPARAGGETEGADVLAALDQELASTQADIARIESEIDADAGTVRGAIDDMAPQADAPADSVLPPRATTDALPDPRTDLRVEPRADNELAGLTAEARAIMPDLRRIVDGERGVSLNQSGPLAARLGVDERNLQLALQQMAVDGLVLRSAKGTFSRLPRRKEGPEDVFTFLARQGGLNTKGFSQAQIERNKYIDNPPRGHDLGTIFQVGRKVEWRRRPDANGQGGIRYPEPIYTTRPALIPGYGPIVRQSGMGLDEAGELLWEAGYFGPPDITPRPDENDVLVMLQNAWGSGEKVYSFYDQAAAADAVAASRAADVPDPNNPFMADFQSEEHFTYEWSRFDRVAEEQFGVSLDEEAFAGVWKIYRARDDDDMGAAVLEAIQREIEDVQARELADRGLDDAEDIIAEWEEALRGSGLAGSAEIPAGRFDPADPGPDGPTFRDPFGEEASGPIDPETWAHWDEPDGPAAKLTTDSLEHDARVALDRGAAVDPAIAARQRQEAQLRADAPMRSTSEQDGTMGSPLFDAVDQPTFRMDEEGDVVNPADLLAEFDEDADFLKNIRDCL